MTKLLKRIALYPLVILYILFEELVYNAVILPVSDRIKSLQVIQRLNALLARFGRYAILITFVLLFVASEGLGATALVMLAQGLVLIGVGLYVVKTLLGIYAFVILHHHKETLFSFGWFAYTYGKIVAVLDVIKSSSAYLEVIAIAHQVKKVAAKRSILAKYIKRLYLAKRKQS
jgi:hypothetical protein